MQKKVPKSQRLQGQTVVNITTKILVVQLFILYCLFESVDADVFMIY